MNEASPRLFNLASARPQGTVMGSLLKLVGQPVERLLSLDAMNDLYQQTLLVEPPRPSYFSSILEVLKINYAVADEDLKKIPSSGPVILVANHPFGAAE